MAFVTRDFVRYFDTSTSAASESQMEQKNKEYKQQRWQYSGKEWLAKKLKRGHEKTMGEWETEDVLKGRKATITDDHYHFDAIQINEWYMGKKLYYISSKF